MLQCVVAGAPISRAEIARRTGLTPATVSDLVGELVEGGLVVELGTGPSAGGKPPTLLGLKASARSVIAVDLSDGRRVGSVLELDGTSAYRTAVFEAAEGGTTGVDALVDTIEELVGEAPAAPLGVGVGTPGVVDDGTVVEASRLDWHGVPLRDLLEERFGLPVYVINNSRAAALAEYSFGEHGAENLLVVKVGHGIGAGIVIDGRIHGGEDSAAGEIGHVVVDPQGPACFCGKRGCLETLAAVPHLVGTLGVHLGVEGPPSVVLKKAAEAAEVGDVAVQHILHEAGRNLAKVLATTVAILDIHKVVVTGLVASLGPSFLAHIRHEIEQAILPTLAAKLDLCYGHTGDRAVRMGAAALVLNGELGVA